MSNPGHIDDHTAIAAALLRDAATSEGADAAALARLYTDNKVARIRVKLGLFVANRGHSRRYFLTQAAADIFGRGHMTKRVKEEAGFRPDAARSRAMRAGWSVHDEPIITADTKVTIAPPPPTGYYKSNWFKGQ